MRCLAIAEALEAAGVPVCFVMADDAATQLVKSRGKKVRILHTRYDRMEEELPVLTAVMEEEHPDMLLIDSYYVSDAYLQRLTGQVWTVYIDDKSFHSYPVTPQTGISQCGISCKRTGRSSSSDHRRK